MKLIKENVKIRCEMGACKNFATHSIKMDRVGIRSHIHVCDQCLSELYTLIGNEVVPKSIETAKRKKA